MKNKRLAWVLASIPAWLACQGQVPALAGPTSTLVKSFNDTTFELDFCEIAPDRTATCGLTVSNRFRDKKIEIDRRIKIQDDLGNDYAVTAGGFGEASSRPEWNQVAVANSTYPLSVVATNLSSRARSVRAVIFTRLLVRSTAGQALGYRDQAIFSNPPMRAASAGGTATPAAGGSTSQAGGSTSQAGAALAADRWHTVGYWDYDDADGRHLTKGLVLRSVPGSGAGKSWQAHLELRNHASLPARDRSLWPVQIHTGQKRVCADYPGYPTYEAYIDLPGESGDGFYQVSRCRVQ